MLGFRAEAAFGTWLHRVTVNVCASALRRRGDARARGQVAGPVAFAAPDSADAFPSGDDTEGRVGELDQARRVVDAIADLPDDARTIVVLRDIGGCPRGRPRRCSGSARARRRCGCTEHTRD